MHFQTPSPPKAALQMNVNMFNHQKQMCFCPVCGGGDPLRGISAAAARAEVPSLGTKNTHGSHRSNLQPHTQQRSGGDTSQNSADFTLQFKCAVS